MWTTLFAIVLAAALGFAVGAVMFEYHFDEHPRRRKPAARLWPIRQL
jgi:hypothetical protein